MDHAALIQEIMQYLEQMIEQCSSLPAFYPPEVTFEHLVQPIDLLVPPRYPERMPPICLDLARMERLRWAGYDWETEESGYGRMHEEKRFVRPYQPMVVLGNSGTGKSWFLRARCLHVAHQQLERLRYDEQSFSTLTVPLFFPARAVAEVLAQETVEPPSLICALLSLLQYQMGFSSAARAWVQSLFGTRRTVLLLDDLHQVLPEHQTRLLEALRTFCLDSPASVIVTTHPASYTGRMFPLEDAPLASFLWNQVRGFVLSWFTLSPGRGQQVLETLHADPFLQTLTRLPMFLPWFCYLATSGESLPTRRVDLYEAILHAFGSLEQEPMHPVIEDYLVARRLSHLPFEAMWDQIRPHLWCDSLWENRILLLASSMQNPTPLLRGILAEEHDAFHWMLLLAGRCLAETEPSRVDPAVVQELTTRLFAHHSSVDASSRRQVAAILERIARPMMLTHYVTQVHNPQDEEKFLEAISRLGTMGDASVVPILLNQLQLQYRSKKERDYGYPERGVLYHALERIGGWESAEALFTLFHNSPPWASTWNVNEALARIHAQGVTQELLRLARDSAVRKMRGGGQRDHREAWRWARSGGPALAVRAGVPAGVGSLYLVVRGQGDKKGGHGTMGRHIPRDHVSLGYRQRQEVEYLCLWR